MHWAAGYAHNAKCRMAHTTPFCAVLSFLLNMNLSDSLFRDVLGILQSLTHATRCLTLPMSHGAFFTTLVKAALPLHIVVALDEPPDTDNAQVQQASQPLAQSSLAGGG
jgi:hypothetical protein